MSTGRHNMILKDAVAILVGAGKLNGIGAATAELLASRGCRILLNTLKSRDQAEKVIAKCQKKGADIALFFGDVTSAETCQEMADFAKKKWGKVDIIVNCQGATKSAPYEKLDKLTSSDFTRLFAVNAVSPYLVVQAFQSLLRSSGNAVVVNVSSAAGITGKGSSIAYATAKGAENTLTLSLAQALSPEVRVNAVCPSFVDSSWWEEAFHDKKDKYDSLVKGMKSSNLLGKVLTPTDVARTILSIIENPVMTGEIIRLDAGAHVGKANVRE
jgi:3-oxoacyl-[acyl-carrier protein] reductase